MTWRKKRARLLAGAGLAVALILGLSLVPNLRADPAPAPPATLNRIAHANDAAAAHAAAQLQARSAESAAAADERRAAEERGKAGADADLRAANAL